MWILSSRNIFFRYAVAIDEILNWRRKGLFGFNYIFARCRSLPDLSLRCARDCCLGTWWHDTYLLTAREIKVFYERPTWVISNNLLVHAVVFVWTKTNTEHAFSLFGWFHDNRNVCFKDLNAKVTFVKKSLKTRV